MRFWARLLQLVGYLFIHRAQTLTSLSTAHEIALSLGGLEGYVLYAPRVGLLSANKEGLVSLTGYLAIHLLGLSTGTLLLPPTPSHFRRQQRAQLVQQKSNADTDTDNDSDEDVNAKKIKTKNGAGAQRQNDKTATELVSYAIVWWVLMGLTYVMGVDDGVSRRMVCLNLLLQRLNRLQLNTFLLTHLGQPVLRALDCGFQHEFHIWLPLSRPHVLFLASLPVCLLCDIRIEGICGQSGSVTRKREKRQRRRERRACIARRY